MMQHVRTSISSLVAAAVISAGLTAGCAPQYASPEQAAANACSALGPRALSGALLGAVGGAAGGAAIGAATGNGRSAAIGAGVGLLAGVIGGLVVGNQLDQQDCQQARIALAQMAEAPVGRPARWISATGSSGSFTPISAAYTAGDGRTCRRFQTVIALHDRAPVQDTGIACRDSQGDWARVTNST